MDDETVVLFDVVDRLGTASIDYMVTGSTAMAFYAVPRMTRDIDLVVRILPEDGDRIFELFHDHYYIDRDAVIRSIKHSRLFNIIDNEKIIKVDLIVRKDNEFNVLEFSRRQRITYGQRMIWVVSPEDLVLSKLSWAKDTGSQLQLRDVKQLMQSVKSIDSEYIRKWSGTLGVSHVLERALQNE
jgi:hypothetical protein